MLLFMKVLFTQFIAEMGDKTQLMLVAMTSKFKLKDILLGTGVAILVLNGLAVSRRCCCMACLFPGTICSGCDRTSYWLSPEEQGTGRNPQYGCIILFFPSSES